MKSYRIVNARIVNEGSISEQELLIRDGFIEKIAPSISTKVDEIIDAKGQYLLPGVIDDQVHFREPGLTHKADIYTESRAAVAGGITSYMEMPNTQPPTFTQELLEQKYQRAAKVSLANYSFYMGTSNDNLSEILKTNKNRVCGVKIFMGSSTGNLLVDNPKTLEEVFSKVDMLIAVHCEDDKIVQQNKERLLKQIGEQGLSAVHHAVIRDAEACYASSSFAVNLAKKYNTRLHVLHISTEKELSLFDNQLPLSQKRITAEACIHHLWFSDEDYTTKGNLIKWNPSIKTARDRAAIWQAVLDNRIDVIATDHAPHTLEEKRLPLLQAPSGGPLVQHSLQAMLDCVAQGKISVQKVVEKMAHAPAILFQIKQRGFIREGYWADLVLVDPQQPYTVTQQNLLYKCKWSPFEGYTFGSTITHTFVSGHLAFCNGKIYDERLGFRLEFQRD
ncbi:MAG: dihydroorotase [Cytophagales bacterium]|nr:dihydroorotase [Cytophagales bacterium]MDW8385283.1 dihydroorotase [Flammeovirgaceae bacterium]